MLELNTRVYGYTAYGAERFEGIYRGKRIEGEGSTARVYKLIELEDGTMYETFLAVYPA